jgi:hypothetical protein
MVDVVVWHCFVRQMRNAASYVEYLQYAGHFGWMTDERSANVFKTVLILLILQFQLGTPSSLLGLGTVHCIV